MKTQMLQKIEEYDSIVIYRHIRPDGDAYGSQFGLKELIEYNYPEKKVYAVGDENDRFSFIGKTCEVTVDIIEKSLVFVLDCSERTLVSDISFEKAPCIIKIDHHIARESFGTIEIVDDTYESCCGLITDIFYNLNFKFNKNSAMYLYTGMVTDSGRFRYDSTTSRTFSLASILLNEGIDITEIYNNLYLDDFEIVKLRAIYVLKMKLTNKNVAYIITTYEEFKELNFDIFTVSRGMVNTMSGIKGIEIWANFTETEDGKVICELRSNKYNINKIAVKYGGGGHAKASGATVDSMEIAMQMLEDLNNLC